MADTGLTGSERRGVLKKMWLEIVVKVKDFIFGSMPN